ncbi:MAG: GNAT family N-acetyltransferase [Anaerolineae bacterium]|nr:GNAT family N-acetyltransferase [Anaerolineae bacterium]
MNPVLLNFPDSFESERLTIRCPRPGDGAPLRAAAIESQTELREWMPWAKEIDSEEHFESLMREAQAKWLKREDLWLLLFLKGTDEFVGGAGLHDCNWDVPSFEIGYWCRTKYVGQGFITESTNAITQFAFDGLKARRVQIRVDVRNLRSCAVAERCGFELEGTLRNESLGTDGNPRNMRMYSRVR